MKQSTVSAILVRLFVLIGLFGLLSLPAKADENACPEDAQQYWKTFRISALQINRMEVANASRFPFVIHGTLDDSEKRNVGREEFVKLLPTLLKADPGLSPKITTMKSLIKDTTRLAPTHCKPNQFRVGDWVFHLTPEGWRFVEAYIEN